MKAVVVKKSKPLPPWLQKAEDEGKKEAKSGKEPSKGHEKGESKKFEAAEDKGAKGKPFADGGKVNKGGATNPKATAKNLPKSAGNAKPNNNLNTMHMKNGGKVKC